MEWIDINNDLPPLGESKDTSIYVIVTDGKLPGYGHYCYDCKCWNYYLIGRIEQDDNDITHWMPFPALPYTFISDKQEVWFAVKPETAQIGDKVYLKYLNDAEKSETIESISHNDHGVRCDPEFYCWINNSMYWRYTDMVVLRMSII